MKIRRILKNDKKKMQRTKEDIPKNKKKKKGEEKEPSHGHILCNRMQKAGARALHYDYDDYDDSQREQRVGDDRKTRRLQRQELISW